MPRLIPSFISQHYQSGERSGEFEAAVLIADVTGFTAFTESLVEYNQEGAEVLADGMQAVFEPLVQRVWAREGFVAGFTGDGLIAIFPGEGQALRRALLATAAINQYTYPTVFPLDDFRPLVRMALTAGHVKWGIVENAGHPGPMQVRAAYYFGGDALATAGELVAELRAGAVGLAPAAAEALSPLIEGEQHGQHVRVTAIHAEEPPLPSGDLPPIPAAAQRAFVPAALAGTGVRGEFRQLVSLFLQVQGAQSHAELDTLFQEVFRLQEKYGGYFADLGQDGESTALLFLWGMPAAFENDVARALSFVSELAEKSALIFRAAITYRPMYAGLVGAAVRQEYGGYGQGISLAFRLLQAASWGSVWLGEKAARQARAGFRLELLGRIPLKGFARRQPAYLLRGPRLGQVENFYRGSLVGREAELASLVSFLAPLARGRFAGILLVRGEAGIGKSRLIHSLRGDGVRLSAISRKRGILPQWFLCPTDPLSQQGLQPFQYFLRRYFGQRDGEAEQVNAEAFARRLDALIASTPEADLAAELERTRSFLAALIGHEQPESLYAQLGEERRFENTLIALKALFKAESLRRPVIIHLEDAHWLDEDSARFLRELTRNIENYPLALILTARPEFSGSRFAEFPRHQTLNLASLGVTGTRALAESFLEGPISPFLNELVWERAEGNPLFAEQILLYLREQRFLLVDEKKNYSLALMPDWALPGNIRSLLLARLDRLRPAVKAVVQTASVLGREFDLDVLAQMLPRVEALERYIDAATDASIWSPLGESRYLFRHILLRDAAYEMQLRARRRDLHRAAAQAIETVYKADAASHASELAYHYGEAGEDERAVTWYWQAGQQAAARYANEAALQHYSRALSLLPPEEVNWHFRLLQARCRIYDLQGNREAQLGELDVLTALARRLGLRAESEVALQRARYANASGDYARAITEAARAITLAETARAHWEWGKGLWRQKKNGAARTHFEKARVIARADGDLRMVARSLNGLGMIADSEGRYQTAAGYYAKALHYQQELSDLSGQSLTFTNLGWLAFMQGRISQAHAHYQQALYLNRKTGDRLRLSTAFNNAGVILFIYGDIEQALAYFRQGLEFSREVGNQTGEATLLSNLALLYHRLGQNEEALAYSKEAIRRGEAWAVPSIQAEALTHQGHALLALGRLAEATASYRRSLALWEAEAQPQMALDALAGLVQSALQSGEQTAAGAFAQRIFTRLEAHPPAGLMEPYRVYLACHQGLAAVSDPCAETILKKAYWNLREQMAKIQDEQTRARFLASAPARQEIVTLSQRASVKR